jgi:hypothetical protein
VLVFKQGDSTVVADAGVRRDARKRVAPKPAAGTAVDRLWTPGKDEDPGPERVN